MILKEFILTNGAFVSIPIPKGYKDVWKLIKSDVFRVVGRNPSLFDCLKFMLHRSTSSLFWFRLCSVKGLLYPFTRLIYNCCQLLNNIDLPPFTIVGYGFNLGHGMGIVINGKTVIGNNVNVSQFLNIGTNHNTPAIIGDNVYIGPSVCIVEDVNIGSNSTIGAGAVVTKDVPANSTVAGVPAKVLNYDNPGRYVNNRWVLNANHNG